MGCSVEYVVNNKWNDDFSYFNGDGVRDTPAHKKGSKNCIFSQNTCPDDVPGIDPGKDPLDNVMSYANDNCAINFTPGQAERMLALFEYYRLDEDYEHPDTPETPPDDPDTPETPPDDPVTPETPPEKECVYDKCTGFFQRLLGLTHKIHNVDGRCREQCVWQFVAESMVESGSHWCGACPNN